MLFRREIDGGIGDAAAPRDPRRVFRLFLGLAAPAEPDAAALAQRLAHRNGKPARPRIRRARKNESVGSDYQPRQKASSQLLLSRIADTTRPTIEYVCGKLPHNSPVTGSISSDKRPSALRCDSTCSKISRASASRPTAQSASTYQNVQMRKAVVGLPKPSSVE